jgi:hypoxanthine phosphoribosyltransferase
LRVLLTEARIQAAIADLAARLDADYRGKPLTVLGVLTGSLIFLADLVRRLDFPLRVGLIQASSYRGDATTPGELVLGDIGLPDLADRDVILLDDIFDTGQTLDGLLRLVAGRGPRSLRSAVLLWKTGRQRVEVTPDYHCFRIPDVFVVGYGLDYHDDYRHLPHVAALEPDDLV